MKLKIVLMLCLVAGITQAQFIPRNDNILKESSELIYDNVQEAQRLLSFVNHSNSEKKHQVLSLLILSDAAYLKGDFVAVMNNLYEAQETAEGNDLQLESLVKCYLAKYYRILGFTMLSKKYILDNSNLKEKAGVYNIRSRILLEQAIVTNDWEEEAKLLNSGLNQIDAGHLFGIPQRNEIQLKLAQLYIRRNLKDSAEYYLKTIIKSEGNVFKATAYLLQGDLYDNIDDYKKADSLLTLSPDVTTQLAVYKKISQHGFITKDRKGYKKYILMVQELEEVLEESRIKSKSLIISHIENQKTEITSPAENYLLFGFVALITCSVAAVFYYLDTKRDYRRFLKIMQKKKQEQKEEPMRIHSIPLKTEQELLKKLSKFEQSQKFLQPDISLIGLAKSLGTNTKYLSDIINRNKEVNFNQYINEQRINYIIDKMKSEPKYLNYKMYYLAEESGFSSQSSFSTVFKSVTGISPLAFIKF